RQAERQAELEREREELRRRREAEQAEARERRMREALEAEEQDRREQDDDPANGRAAGASAAEIQNRWGVLIKNRVEQNWVRPQGQRPNLDLETVVNLSLEPGGAVIPGSVRVVESSGRAAYDQSVVAAIYRASPLPVPEGDEFELIRDLQISFRP
ncbi:MAG: cell envelope integrity protein TolA, partial [Halochromatium sp.]|uniref:cell envelope integrity protein TolA n=1 Tax=Halochromatium sp. TaxID=2049430 RepID=UPI00397D3FCE